MEKIINIAVIAHVDAGKSTLVDAMLRQNQYHEISNMKKKDLLAKIKERLGRED